LLRVYNTILDSGKIRHKNYENNEDLEWTIAANCSNVNLISTQFETEAEYDYVTIAGTRYEGTESMSVTVPNLTVVHFHSDGSTTKSGFILKWTCEDNLQGTYNILNFDFAVKWFIS